MTASAVRASRPLVLASAGIGVVGVTFGMARDGFGLLAPDIRASFGLTSGALGLLAAASYVAYLGTSLTAGVLSAHLGARAIVAAGGACAVGGMVLAGVAQSPGVLFVPCWWPGPVPGSCSRPSPTSSPSACRPTGGRGCSPPSAPAPAGVLPSPRRWPCWPAPTGAPRGCCSRWWPRPRRVGRSWFCPDAMGSGTRPASFGFGRAGSYVPARARCSWAGRWWESRARSTGPLPWTTWSPTGGCPPRKPHLPGRRWPGQRGRHRGRGCRATLGGRAVLALALAVEAAALVLIGVAPGQVSAAMASAVLFGVAYNVVVAVQVIWSGQVFGERPSAGLAAA